MTNSDSENVNALDLAHSLSYICKQASNQTKFFEDELLKRFEILDKEMVKIKDTLAHAEEGIRALFRHIERIDRLSRATERRLKDIERKQ